MADLPTDQEAGGEVLDERAQARESKRLADRLMAIVGRLEAEATRRIGQRATLEERWLEDLGQYHGQYDAETEKRLNQGEASAARSKLYINYTRPKTDAMSARLMDLLFPTDDKNWAISPTPVPRLNKDAEAARKAQIEAEKALEAAQMAAQQQEGGGIPPELQALQDAAGKARKAAEELQAQIEEARRRSDLMSSEIDDQMKESNYQAAARDLIDDACKIGTGILKGPVTGDRIRKGWQQGPDGQFSLQMSDGDRPGMRWVDPWSFFPDMDVRHVDDGDTLERHLMNPKMLKGLAKLKGFRKEAIRELLRGKPRGGPPSYLLQLRNISKDKDAITNDVYHVWEFSGCLTAEDMLDLALAVGDERAVKDLDGIDPLAEINAVVWFCDGQLLKFAVYPYDSGECMYSVYNLVKDESSVFGYGIPALVRDPQKAINAAWRQMMDNGALATGPQILIALGLIEPADGDWTLTPRKVWHLKEGQPAAQRFMETFDIPMHQAELANIIVMAKQFIDDVTGMPQIAQGEQGTGVTKTAQGMALLMNSANVVFRRFVKNFDDDVTVPNIRRFYDWNMQHNGKEEIKGDYEVIAQGSSVLLVREMQSQTLMAVATQLGGHPIYGPMLRNREVLRKLFQSLMIPSGDLVLKDSEIDAVLAQAAAQDATAQAEAAKVAAMERANDLKEREIEVKVQIANMQNDSVESIEMARRETALIQLAQTSNMKLDELANRLQIARETIAPKERMFAAEVAIEQRNAEEARARGEDPDGSGGYVSGGGAKKKPEKRPDA